MVIATARSLRQTSTSPEIKLWYYLRNRQFFGLKFRRQYPIGPYIVDFVCLDQKLIIELDGGQHVEQHLYDSKRTTYLEHFNFRVIRFWNHDVLTRMDIVLEQIRLCVEL